MFTNQMHFPMRSLSSLSHTCFEYGTHGKLKRSSVINEFVFLEYGHANGLLKFDSCYILCQLLFAFFVEMHSAHSALPILIRNLSQKVPAPATETAVFAVATVMLEAEVRHIVLCELTYLALIMLSSCSCPTRV